MNEVIKAIKERRSCRKYTSEPVSRELLDQIVEAGLYAPSGMGKQSAKILVITRKEVRDQLAAINAQVMGREGFDPFYGAPAVILVIAPKDWLTAQEDGNLVLANMMLAAHSLGLSSCFIHRAAAEVASEQGRALLAQLGIEGEWQGIGHIIVGHGDAPALKAAERKADRVHFVE